MDYFSRRKRGFPENEKLRVLPRCGVGAPAVTSAPLRSWLRAVCIFCLHLIDAAERAELAVFATVRVLRVYNRPTVKEIRCQLLDD